jgi:hypothetical protein
MPKDTPVEDFDLDAWITDARLPERSVTVYGRADLVAEHTELEEQLRRVQRASLDDERLADPSVDLALRLAEAEERMQSSALTFRFRALLRDETDAIDAAAPKDKDGEPDADYKAAAWLAASSISPKLTIEQAQAVRSKIGEAQFLSLWATAFSASNDRRVDVPFSPAASAARKNAGS